ncbi:diguanylate cyclase [Desulfitispora alkaliphila]|uniref:GGDEF domain-containing protein n=1 Tax=Desulfitispora alkaliphila TaxID=622674 RepID=UPI003D1BC0B1
MFLLLIIVSVIIISLSFRGNQGLVSGGLKAEKGYLDVTGWDFKEEGLLPLRGQWEFYWMELLGPEDFNKEILKPDYITLPTELSRKELNGKALTTDGYATLRIKIKLSNLSEVYGLKAKYLTSASKVYVNGRLLASAGRVGVTPIEYSPQYNPLELTFKSEQELVEIIVQIANFHHQRIKLDDIILGTANQIERNTHLGIIRDSIMFGSLFVVALYYFIIFYLQRRNLGFIFFSVIALIMALRLITLNERILVRVYPDFSPELLMKLGYWPVFILLPLLILYLKEIFNLKIFERPTQIAKWAIAFFTAVVLLTSVKVYDWLFQYGLVLVLLSGLYIIYLVATREEFVKKQGHCIMVAGGLIIFAAGISDFLREIQVIEAPELLSFGVLIFILLQAFFLSWRFNEAFNRSAVLVKENAIMYKKLQGVNQFLEQKIMERTIELERANKKLKKLAKHDALTGLPNRRNFDEKLQEEWKRSIREKQPLSLIIMDIDFFKEFNDKYGHMRGDECLTTIAKEVERTLKRSTDMCAKYGGEEFIVILPNTNAQGAMIIAEKIKENVENLSIPHTNSRVSNVVTVSLGLNTIIPSQDDKIEDFINKADQALYMSKKNGRNKISKGKFS